jgi:GT2 family glycosyltransferase
MDPHVVSLGLPVRSVSLRARRLLRPQVDALHLSVVVVNYHHWNDTAHLVRQLRCSSALRRGQAEIVVIDNHSPVNRVARGLRRLRGVSLRRFGSNRGFARAVNEGRRLSRGDWLLLLNPDVTLSPDFLDEALALSRRLSSDPRQVGIVGFRLDNPDGTRQLSTGRFPTLLGTLTRLLLPRSRRKYSETPTDTATGVDWATGCCLLVRRDCLEQLGGFDPNFFLYYEDVDFCQRARQAGWEVAFEPGLAVVHHHPLHGRRVPPHLRLITRHALLTYAHKHWSRWKFRLLGRIVRLEAWSRKWWARLRGKTETAQTFATLEALSNDLLGGRHDLARIRVRRVVRLEEKRLGTIAVHRNSEPASR